MIRYHLILLSLLNVHCEELATRQPFIYDKNGLARVNFFAKKELTYVGCMVHCQNMGGRSPPVRTKKELGDMKGILEDLSAFPSFPEKLFLSVTM